MKKTIYYLLLLFTCFASCSAEKEKQFEIAYNVAVDLEHDNYDVFAMKMDGSEKRNITHHPDVAWAYVSGKDKVYFISDRDSADRKFFLYSMDKNGNNCKRISNLRLEDSWISHRNNETEMIVSGRISKEIRYQLFLIDVNNGTYKQLTNDTAAKFADPVFSPDGKYIVCTHKKNRRDTAEIAELYRMNLDGSNAKQLTHYPENDEGRYGYHYKAGPPRWNSKENFISYQSYQKGKYSLFAVNAEGSKQWKLTDLPYSEGWHDWSSDSKWLAIELFDSLQTQFSIGLMNWESKQLKILTDSTYKYNQAPSFIEVSK